MQPTSRGGLHLPRKVDYELQRYQLWLRHLQASSPGCWEIILGKYQEVFSGSGASAQVKVF